ncbi:Protein CBG20465 [Caenorhabditis briggsae]|uniref:Protein CBG20465 n=1 Tax=Caenorhabditis briggsae TaxID=6238 RepID=A8XXV1_CAEBR|nr:Protein CBG20465 [Caenorhabditis briggsae]CAP37470.2 Protein CBG20465 [Caenorhabditis briggsae]
MTARKRKIEERDKKEDVKKKILSPEAQKKMNEFYDQQNELLQKFEQDQETIQKPIKKAELPGAKIFSVEKCIFKTGSSISEEITFRQKYFPVVVENCAAKPTFVDSSMDIACSFVMNICLSAISKTDALKYPRGRDRLELIGVILCSVIMAFANVSMIMQSINSIVNDTVDPKMTNATFAIIAVQTVLKAIIMWMCYKRGSTSSLVIAMDLRNDLITRSLALVCGYLGDYVWKFADPIGAICVCTWIAYSWCRHAVDNIPQLVGISAERDQMARILNITLKHDERIKYIDHSMIYYTGLNAQVELHIVLDEKLPLKITHDISHDLEKNIQKLDFVERCFVHVDYNCDGD